MGTCLNCIVKGDLSFFSSLRALKGLTLGREGNLIQTSKQQERLLLCTFVEPGKSALLL